MVKMYVLVSYAFQDRERVEENMDMIGITSLKGISIELGMSCNTGIPLPALLFLIGMKIV